MSCSGVFCPPPPFCLGSSVSATCASTSLLSHPRAIAIVCHTLAEPCAIQTRKLRGIIKRQPRGVGEGREEQGASRCGWWSLQRARGARRKLRDRQILLFCLPSLLAVTSVHGILRLV